MMNKDMRKGKVFIDWSQNDEHKTTVAVYSLRAKERPTVSTPLRWEELTPGIRPRDFGMEEALRRARPEDAAALEPLIAMYEEERFSVHASHNARAEIRRSLRAHAVRPYR